MIWRLFAAMEKAQADLFFANPPPFYLFAYCSVFSRSLSFPLIIVLTPPKIETGFAKVILRPPSLALPSLKPRYREIRQSVI